MDMSQIIEQSRKVKPYSEKNGRKNVSFEDYAILANMEGINAKMGNVTDTGDRRVNADGTIASSRAPFVAMSEEKMLDNRYMVKRGEMYVVTDERILYELRHKNQNCPYKQVPAYVIKKDDTGYVLDRTELVSDSDFMAKFTERLKPEQIKEIWHLIEGAGEINEPSEMPI